MKLNKLITHRKFNSLAHRYVIETGLPLYLIDLHGIILYAAPPVPVKQSDINIISLENLDTGWLIQAVEGAYRWGEIHFSTSPSGLICFAIPVMHQHKQIGAFISGFIIYPEIKKDFIDSFMARNKLPHMSRFEIPIITKNEIRKFSSLLLEIIKQERWIDIPALKRQQERNEQQQYIATFLEQIRKEPLDVSKTVFEKQDAIIQKVKYGDITGAKKIINEFLGVIFLDCGMDFNLLKVRIMEFLIIISHTAIEYGIDLKEMMGRDYGHLTRLNTSITFEELCHELTTTLEHYINTVKTAKVNKKKIEFQKMIEYINRHFYEKLSVLDIARAADLSVSRAIHLFKEETGQSITDYIKMIRIDFSKYLLTNSNKSIAEVSIEAGFFDQSHFTKNFKCIEKITPMEFRQQFKKN